MGRNRNRNKINTAMKKIYKLYLFSELIYKSNNLLLIQAYKNTYKEELKKYLVIK